MSSSTSRLTRHTETGETQFTETIGFYLPAGNKLDPEIAFILAGKASSGKPLFETLSEIHHSLLLITQSMKQAGLSDLAWTPRGFECSVHRSPSTSSVTDSEEDLP